jgi:hypothetical protein
MFGSVPASKVSDTSPPPCELLEDMYTRPSMPCMDCSITCVTDSSIVAAEAPG